MPLVRWIRAHLVAIAGLMVLSYLLIPNLVVIVFSFNKPSGTYNYQWERFSLDAWTNPYGVPGICDALGLSLRIGLTATLVSTILGPWLPSPLAAIGSGAARARTCSSSCRWPPPRSSWAQAC